MAALRLVQLALVCAIASGQFCSSLHADFMRMQAQDFSSTVPFNESKGKKHTPYITIDGTKGTVKVGDGSPFHPMVASADQTKVHFITHIYVLDQSGNFVAMSRLDPTGGGTAQMTFDVPKAATKLVAYEWCNLHGLWVGPEKTVTAGPNAATCAKPTVPKTSQVSIIADLKRLQAAAPFSSAVPYNESKGKKHTPYITLSGTTGTVNVGDGNPYHPMVASTDQNKVHWISLIYVLDQAGNIVTMQNLDPTGVDKATITFTVPSGATSLTAYEWCNKHGLWVGPEVKITTATTTGATAISHAHNGMSLGVLAALAVVVKFAMMP